jgi:DNA modification methylase
MTAEIIHGKCDDVLPMLEAESFHACVTDPPYHLVSQDKRPATRQCPHAHRRLPSSGFMGQAWDGGDVAFRPETWAAVHRVLKPGAHLLAFGGTRTYHRLACAIEDAGFEIRDTIMWLYGSGFPKSHDVSKAIDRAAGAEREIIGVKIYGNGETRTSGRNDTHHEGYRRPWWEEDPQRSERLTASATEAAREWEGWGTALKPAAELICVARKPCADVPSIEICQITGWDQWCSAKSDGEDKIITGRALHPAARSFRVRIDKHGREVARDDLGEYEPFVVDAVAANVLKHGAGALNIDASRVGTIKDIPASVGYRRDRAEWGMQVPSTGDSGFDPNIGRWPANVCHDGSPEVLDAFAKFGERTSGSGDRRSNSRELYGVYNGDDQPREFDGNCGTAARFFFCAKADSSERIGSHPTVKPVALMEWLVGLVTPRGGRLLDPFA